MSSNNFNNPRSINAENLSVEMQWQMFVEQQQRNNPNLVSPPQNFMPPAQYFSMPPSGYFGPPPTYYPPSHEPYPPYSSQIPPQYPNTSTNSHNTIVDDNQEEENDGGTPSSGRLSLPQIGSRKNTWLISEDEALVSSFLRVSTDPIVGTNQKGTSLWVRVKSLFDLAKKENPTEIRVRTSGMLNSRFCRLPKLVALWVGHYEDARRNISSGKNEDDVIQVAHQCYEPIEGGRFNYEIILTMLKKYPRWKEILKAYGGDIKITEGETETQDFRTKYRETPFLESDADTNGSDKRTRLNDGGFSTPNEDVDEGGVSDRRPPGVKISKKNRGKAKVKGGVNDNFEKLSETIQGFASTRVDNTNYHWEKLEFAKKKEARKQEEADRREAARRVELELQRKNIEVQEMNVKRNLLHALIQKPVLRPEEEVMKIHLMRELGYS